MLDGRRASGIRLLRGRAARAPAGAGARRGAELRPAAQDPRARRRRDRRASRWTTKGSTRTRSRPSSRRRPDPPSFLYTIPTFQNPSGRTLSTERRRRVCRDRRRARARRSRGRPVRPRALRGRALRRACLELEGGDLVTLHVVVLEDRRARAPRPATSCSRTRDRGRFEERAVSTYISPPFLAQATMLEFIAVASSSRTSSSVCGKLRARRDAMLARSSATFPAGSSWSRPEGGYFVWLDLGDERATRPSSPHAPKRRALRSCAASRLLPARLRARARAPRASRSATRRRSGSPRESSGSRACSSRPDVRCGLAAPSSASQLVEQVAGGEADADAEQDQDEQSRSCAEKKTKLTSTCLRLKRTMRIA